MITLVTGGSKCGRSSYAEGLLQGAEGAKIYIATMMPYGEEAQITISRHREMRRGKGFETVERYTDIGGAVIPLGSSVLIEDIGNLCANEMFCEEPADDPCGRIVSGIKALAEKAEDIVMVTSQTGSDGIDYDGGTAEYIKVLGQVNAALAQTADNVIECVYGIPVALKGKIG